MPAFLQSGGWHFYAHISAYLSTRWYMFNGIELILPAGCLILMRAVPFRPQARNNMPKTKTYRGWLVGVVLAGVLLMLQAHSQIRTARAQDQIRIDTIQDPPSRRGAAELCPGVGYFSAGRRRRLGDGCSQPAADQRRQSLDRPGLARRTACRLDCDTNGAGNQHDLARSRRSHHAASLVGGHA